MSSLLDFYIFNQIEYNFAKLKLPPRLWNLYFFEKYVNKSEVDPGITGRWDGGYKRLNCCVLSLVLLHSLSSNWKMLIWKTLFWVFASWSFAAAETRESKSLEESGQSYPEVLQFKIVSALLFGFMLVVTAALASMLPLTYFFGFYFGRFFIAPVFYSVSWSCNDSNKVLKNNKEKPSGDSDKLVLIAESSWYWALFKCVLICIKIHVFGFIWIPDI